MKKREDAFRHDADEISGKAFDLRIARRMLGYVRPYRGLFALSVVIDSFETTRNTLGWVLGWPRHAAEAVAGESGFGEGGAGSAAFAFYHLLNFVYLYVLSAVILWLRGRRRRT